MPVATLYTYHIDNDVRPSVIKKNSTYHTPYLLGKKGLINNKNNDFTFSKAKNNFTCYDLLI